MQQLVCDFYCPLANLGVKATVCHSGDVFCSAPALITGVPHPDSVHVTVKPWSVRLPNEGHGRWEETSRAFHSDNMFFLWSSGTVRPFLHSDEIVGECVRVCGGFKNNATECFWLASSELSLLFKCPPINVAVPDVWFHQEADYRLPVGGAAGFAVLMKLLQCHYWRIYCAASIHGGKRPFGIHLRSGDFSCHFNRCVSTEFIKSAPDKSVKGEVTTSV